MAICPICERSFDERAYQLVIPDVGTFDSVDCAEEALRRHTRRARGEFVTDLIDAVNRERTSADDASEDAPQDQAQRFSS